ncbi:multifunctional oxoglutarate decarboxylase/oxoglutarate dehydrogenase thiamine pyrophosphate-binding subunit/dihydrolipoyllysine-residue succinyltransferase subunit [Arsenicicoccus piscis]|uniref:Alpha-ketoglutarate decarboxylase n=1 Tax=Arsenicicoccus piscis TaxID=673954 RepID=A0ABQ6HJ65_9MICO|nr:multifunctional oxoglutarate decarboxylase/oxoglutarate dehydrogenase thiamine pyrophosphate-binding subunit/dihydrolipoyllysine-residue succinyltransferase subunit [Arsenicicoccus piscis]MCH8628270.1 multifunctional oxoglutarate decarboxylase/oxoglutarate dehydrogenase thiamine pyrophosphate-binding subunit/dihydrolipoyllysine-residue succinyltransferase subunit [Arsenicicoccus piscis]GMA18523.1 alpha-ketoglutarate decarboxylase [Arsenicicoccus piscis]
MASFGANEWLVDELYDQYLRDKNSVDKAWWPFFQNYKPTGEQSGKNGSGTPTAGAAAATSSARPTAQSEDQSSAQNQAPATVPSERPQPTQSRPEAKAPADQSGETPTDPGDHGGRPVRASERPVDLAGSAQVPSSRPTAQVEAPTPNAPVAQAAQAMPRDIPQVKRKEASTEDQVVALKGPAARIVTNMDASLTLPTATSVRSVPAKALIDNRTVINNHLRRSRGGKISFTHVIAYAMVKALEIMPDMNYSFGEQDGKPALVKPGHVNLGIAIDLPKPDGTRSLVVPSIKAAEQMDFVHFWTAYEDLIRKARNNKLTIDDFAGTTISLTNPGGIGTVHSVPRLMKGQGTIIGVGALDYPAEWQGASQETINRMAVSKMLTLTSTYDHRVIQGAASGQFLKIIHELLLGEHGFYDEIFVSLRIPYEPVRWIQDISAGHEDDVSKGGRVQELIHAYRVRGHLMADIDPLEYQQRRHADLDVANHGLTLWDLEREFPTAGFGNKPIMTLREILGILRDSYCRTVGVEYMHIQDPEQRAWIQDKVEHRADKQSSEDQLRILRRLNAAEAFETFLQTKFVGQKRFSLEGGESVIALLDRILSRAAEEDLDEVCIGMPHRGRLNVLANLAGKSYGQIFQEFEGTQDPKSVQGSGDVKYHLGTEGTFTSEEGAQTKVYLAANPSHLEAVDPVLEGIVRAKQDRLGLAGEAFTVLPILMHGDAAFAGQGVVAETLQLSQLRGYRTGGTIHVVVNNQVGFTTAPSSSRSSVYSTDLARTIQAPIFHVNGDDPEACVRVAEIAFEYRQRFAKDVVIDMVCYRRRGHNEGDDPSMTQPLMYNLIEAKRSVRKLYTESLIGRGDITMDEAEGALKDYQQQLERVFVETRAAKKAGTGENPRDNAGLERPEAQAVDNRTPARDIKTSVDAAILQHIGDAFVAIPEGFTVHPKLRPLLEKRAQMVREGGIDWGMGELLAFGTLLMEGTPVRLAGQDSRRGTFVQRHAVLIDKVTAEEWTPLLYLGSGQARFTVHDSLLSEYAAMGFEYGYSVERPETLVLWEAQFGDFANGAQTIIDEFISSSEQKWGQRSSVVLLLPHGYEGQGPDHSSARIERYLQMCAQDNMTVAYPSTPASYFHLLRRQAYARPRRPLIVATPKSMLRLKAAASSVEEFTDDTFRPVMHDRSEPALDAGSVDRVLLCAGKVYYELDAERAKRKDTRTAILTLEQLAPLPAAEIAKEVAAYPGAELVWVQEEPANQGAWSFVDLNRQLLVDQGETRPLRLVSRPASASPATGSSKKHAAEQADLVERAFAR